MSNCSNHNTDGKRKIPFQDGKMRVNSECLICKLESFKHWIDQRISMCEYNFDRDHNALAEHTAYMDIKAKLKKEFGITEWIDNIGKNKEVNDER